MATSGGRHRQRSPQVVEVHAESSAEPEAVWRLLGDVTTWPRWSRFDAAAYDREGTPPPHGVGAVRRMRAGRLRSIENVLVYDEPSRFAYDYTGSLPLDGYRADVTLSPHDGGTVITWHSEFTGRYPMSGPVLRLMLGRVLQDLANRLARAAEDRPRP